MTRYQKSAVYGFTEQKRVTLFVQGACNRRSRRRTQACQHRTTYRIQLLLELCFQLIPVRLDLLLCLGLCSKESLVASW